MPFKNVMFLLPTESTQVVVQYNPRLSIGTVIPSAKRTISVAKNIDPSGFQKIQTPDLLWFQQIEVYGWGANNAFTMYIIDSKVQDKIMAQPFVGPHVNGQICWGAVKQPGNIKDAHARFWASNFRYAHVFQPPVPGNYRDMTQILCGQRFIASPNHQQAVFVSDVPETLKKVPDKFWRTGIQGDPTLIGFANLKRTTWEIQIQNGAEKFALKMSEKELVTSKTPQAELR